MKPQDQAEKMIIAGAMSILGKKKSRAKTLAARKNVRIRWKKTRKRGGKL